MNGLQTCKFGIPLIRNFGCVYCSGIYAFSYGDVFWPRGSSYVKTIRGTRFKLEESDCRIFLIGKESGECGLIVVDACGIDDEIINVCSVVRGETNCDRGMMKLKRRFATEILSVMG